MPTLRLHLHDTLSAKLTPVEPRHPGELRVYTCGPTVYDVAHIGHARAAIGPDILVRHARGQGLTVNYVRNVTDVDDKILKRAAASGEAPLDLSARMTRLYQEDVEALAAHAGVPVYNGLTNEWHPTQMLADFLTMHEASNKPYDRLAYAYVGDCRFNMGRSLLVMGALMGSDVRLAGPEELHPPKDVVDQAAEIARHTGARITVTDDATSAVSGVDFIHTDVEVAAASSEEAE